MTLARDASLSLREGVPALGLRTDYLKHFREAGRSVRERQCWPRVARPIIYDTSARRARPEPVPPATTRSRPEAAGTG